MAEALLLACHLLLALALIAASLSHLLAAAEGLRREKPGRG
jgi:hypothetical protein